MWIFAGPSGPVLDAVLDVPDTPANAEAFGRSGNEHAASPFPQLRLVAVGGISHDRTRVG